MKLNQKDWLNALANQNKFRLDLIRYKFWGTNPNFKYGPAALKNNLLIYLETGTITLIIEDKKEVLQAGSLLWLNPFVVREMWISSNSNITNHRVHFNLFEGETLLVMDKPYQIQRNCGNLKPIFRRMNTLTTMRGSLAQYSMRATFLDLFATFFHNKDIEQNRIKEPILNDVQSEKVQNYLKKNINHPIRSVDLANAIKLSPDYFSRLFKQTYGVSPRSYIKEERIRHASHILIETNLKINEVAQLCGCDNMPLFTRQFKEVFHCTPSRFRQNRG